VNRIWLSLRYSSALPVRCLLAIAAASWAVLFITAPQALVDERAYRFLFELAAPVVWALLFAVDALLLIWRMIESRSRIGWTRVINAYTCGLWIFYLACEFKARGFVAPDCAFQIALLAGAIWNALRSDLTVGDRESA
jgi:hypothetical protein